MAAPAATPLFYMSGPVHHWIRPAGTSPYLYLGTAEVTPKVEFRKFWLDVFNTIGGRSVPMQKTEDGEMAVIGTLMTRFSKSTYDTLQDLGASIEPGWRNRISRGSFAFGTTTNNASFEVWLVFEYATIPAVRQPNQHLGVYFPQVILGGHTLDTLGTETEKLLTVFEAYPQWQLQASPSAVQGNERSWRLYSLEDDVFTNNADVLVPQ